MVTGNPTTVGSPERVTTQRLPDLKNVRILAVDDDPQARALIEMALADAPFTYELEVIPTAASGIRRIADAEHDVYLIDQQLPDGNGVDLIHRAKSEGITRPFILMTGHGSGALDEAASREGAADYVEKHMVGAHLERSIRYALRNWQAARALSDREEQLRQAQKMEAIGRLAGAIAHDFNNLLTAIIGYADMIGERENPDETLRDAGEIRKVADRAASLTRQLLAFSRKQFLDPVVLDINDAISGLLQVLPRVIGERVHLQVKLGTNLAAIKADAGQVEQMLLNLVLNARDAMPDGGNLAIETANAALDHERLGGEGLTLPAGNYVMLLVADTGIGMDDATRARAFEPFFTTKPRGKGTGLGLATVYGIVDQSGGQISLDTAPGRGTTFRIYLPVTTAAREDKKPTFARVEEDGGTETVLLVEDNDAVRELSALALRRRGYEVHEAANAEEAMEWARTSGHRPDLLVTDIVMPGLNGSELAKRLTERDPSLRVLFISGYTEAADEAQGAYLGGIPFLQKPFTAGKLAERVRLVLDRTA
jgi:two-component system, cell cycle sensor histidine kinase and response regulator CckA